MRRKSTTLIPVLIYAYDLQHFENEYGLGLNGDITRIDLVEADGVIGSDDVEPVVDIPDLRVLQGLSGIDVGVASDGGTGTEHDSALLVKGDNGALLVGNEASPVGELKTE